ncbi:MAG: hypothetical protein RJQ14_24125 [Marinoscillum sp.]
MIEDDFLPFFINEDIFIVDDGTSTISLEKPKNETTQPPTPIKETSQVKEPDEAIVTPTIPKPTPSPATTHELAIWTPPLTSDDRDLLVKILAAIKKDFAKAHLMEGINSYSVHYKKLLCFGYDKELELKLGQSLERYAPTLHASQQVLCSVSPAELHADPSQKKRLWEALQKMFL